MNPIRVNQPDELLAAVPYLIGFHPTESLVLVGIREHHLHFVLRVDLDEYSAGSQASAAHLTTLLDREHIDASVIIGYGNIDEVTPTVETVRHALTDKGIKIIDALRVTDGRFYSYECRDIRCCPPTGRPFRPESSIIAAEATVEGYVALPDRATLTRSLAPVTGPARTSMAHATDQAEERLITGLERSGGSQALITEGIGLIEKALNRHYAGKTLADEEVAWLTMLLTLVEVRDAGNKMIEEKPEDPHIALWTDVIRRAQPGMVAAAGTLLAYAAYLEGSGALASVALERALSDDPEDRMARSLHKAIMNGLPPHQLRTRRARRASRATERAGPDQDQSNHTEPVRGTELIRQVPALGVSSGGCLQDNPSDQVGGVMHRQVPTTG